MVASALAVTAGLTHPAAAGQEITLACLTKNPSSRDWVPKSVLVKIDPDTLRAMVFDEFTLEVFEGGAMADLRRPTANRVQLAWKLVGVQDSQDRRQNVDFKMTIDMKRGTFNYAGLGESFFLTPGSAHGRCVEAK